MLGGDLRGELLAVGDVGDHDAGALGGERLRVVPADALGAAGDDRGAAGESRHGLTLPDLAAGERLEGGELLLDQVDRGLVLELERLLVELLRREGDDDLGAAEQDGVDRGERHAQVILHARAAEDAAGAGLQHDRLVLERLVLHPRHPVDGVLEPARDRPIVPATR